MACTPALPCSACSLPLAQPIRMVRLMTADDGFGAKVVAARLGVEGIVWELRGGVDGPYPFGPVHVFVPESELAEAQALLAATAPLDEENGDGDDEEARAVAARHRRRTGGRSLVGARPCSGLLALACGRARAGAASCAERTVQPAQADLALGRRRGRRTARGSQSWVRSAATCGVVEAAEAPAGVAALQHGHLEVVGAERALRAGQGTDGQLHPARPRSSPSAHPSCMRWAMASASPPRTLKFVSSMTVPS